MSVTARRLATLAAPLLLAGSLSSCGAFGGPPTDASAEDFCAAFNGPIEDLTQAAAESGEEPPAADIAAALETQVDQLEETGTPEDLDDDARNGFEVYIDQIGGLDKDEMAEAIESGDEDGLTDVSDDDEDDVDDFTSYASETCGSPGL